MPQKARQLEQALHRAVANYLGLQARNRFFWTTIPNGGYRRKIEAAIFKSMGVKPGVADLMLVGPGGRAYFIELKSETGRISPEQLAFMESMRGFGVPAVVCRSIEDVKGWLKEWGLL